MRFRDLPRPAKMLVVGICLVGVAALAWGLVLPAPRNIVSAFIYVALAFLVAARRVVIHRSAASIQLGFVLVLAALFRCGTGVAIAAAVVNILGCYVLRPRSAGPPGLWTTAYNIASLVVTTLAAGLAHGRLSPHTEALPSLERALLPALAAVGVYYSGSILAVGLASTLTELKLPPRRWWTELAWLAPVYLAGGAGALALNEAVEHFGQWVFVVGLPFAYVIHRSFVTQADKLSEEIQRLEDRAEASEALAKVYMSVLQALANAIDAKDHGTHLHTERVQALTSAVARRLGITGDGLKAIDTAAVLHDIGKLAVPDSILLKPGRLSDEEVRLMQSHTAAGEAILQPIDFGADVASIVRHHHEKVDGSGYPDGLGGEETPLGAKILAVVDVYDALVSDRPYRKAWTAERAAAYLREETGSSFDARVVEALVEVLESGDVPERARATPAEPLLPFSTALPTRLAAGQTSLRGSARHEAERHARNCMLTGVVEQFAGKGTFEACVAYLVSHESAEIDAVAAAGGYAGYFERTRIPLGIGPSGQAATTGEAVYDAEAAGDLSHFAQGPPRTLSQASVAAIPILSSTGETLGVLSLYLAEDAALTPSLAAEASLVAAMLGRQMEQTRRPAPPLPVPQEAAAK